MSPLPIGFLLIILGTGLVADPTQENDDVAYVSYEEYILQDDDTPESGIIEEEADLYAPEVETNSTDSTENLTNSTDTALKANTSSVFVNCTKIETTPVVEIMNSTRLLSLLVVNPNVTRAMAADCLVVLFHARWCPFSSMAAPHFNALPRAFPNLKMAAVDAMKYHTFNTQYGIVGVPTVILFHNGRPAVRFNGTEYTLEHFSRFITKFTTIPPVEKMFVTSADFQGPVSSVMVKETDPFLVLSWAFLGLLALVSFIKSSWCRWLVEAIQNTWRESEAQHEHID